jgi:hypothetical protein
MAYSLPMRGVWLVTRAGNGQRCPAWPLSRMFWEDEFVMAEKQPQWQPITMLPRLSSHIDGMVQADQEQYETLLEAKPKPYVLDDATVGRVIHAFTTQRDGLALFDEQLHRWSAEPALTSAQSAEITRLQKQMATLRHINTEVLALAEELKKGTIEQVLGLDDAELGLRFLLGDLPGQGQKKRD